MSTHRFPGPVKSKRPTPDNQLGMSRVNKQTVNVHTHYIRCEHCSPEWLPPTGERQVILSTQQVSEGVPTLRYWSGGERAREGGGSLCKFSRVQGDIVH